MVIPIFVLPIIRQNAGVENPYVLLIDTDSQGHTSLITTGRIDYGHHDKQFPQYLNVVVIDTRASFSLMTGMALRSATDALIPVEPRCLETTMDSLDHEPNH